MDSAEGLKEHQAEADALDRVEGAEPKPETGCEQSSMRLCQLHYIELAHSRRMGQPDRPTGRIARCRRRPRTTGPSED